MSDNVHTWDDKIIYNDDGWGYRVSEGDEGEIVVYYFEETPEGRNEKEQFRAYNSSAHRRMLEACIAKLDQMDFDNLHLNVGNTVEFNNGGEPIHGRIERISGLYLGIEKGTVKYWKHYTDIIKRVS